jgi:hypothetical protein
MVKYTNMTEKCLNVMMGDPDLVNACQKAAESAEKHWRSMGEGELFECQIATVVSHPFPAIPPTFVQGDTLERMRLEAEETLGKRVIQIDGIRSDGLVNVLTE